MNEISLLGRSADWYAAAGWKILPCLGLTNESMCTCGGRHSDSKDIGKHPVISGWNTGATSDRSQIQNWWLENPDYNIGVYTKGSGFFVIDIDPRSGGDDSFLEFERMVEGHLPPTVEAFPGEYM